MKERVIYIDQLKGVAMLLVVMGHVLGFDFFSWETLQGTFLNNLITSIQMPLFFFLSGLVVKKQEITPPLWQIIGYQFRRAWSLLVPMVVVGIVYVTWRGFSVTDFFFHPMKYGYWYLLTLFEFYVIYMLFFEIVRFKKAYMDVGLFLLSFVLFKLLMHLPISNNVIDMLQLNQLVQYWPFFFLGFFLNQRNYMTYLFTKNLIYTLSLLVYISLFAWNYYYGIGNLVLYIYQLAGVLVLSFLFWKMKERKAKVLQHLAYIGRNTLDIYIFHYFFIHAAYMKCIGIYLVDYPNIILELMLTGGYALIITYASIGVGMIIRSSNFLSMVLFNKK